MIAHSWKFSNDYLAALLYLEGCRTVSAIDAFCRSNWIDLNARGMGLGSMAMRVKNIEAIGTGKGLTNFAQQTMEVWTACNGLSASEIRSRAGI